MTTFASDGSEKVTETTTAAVDVVAVEIFEPNADAPDPAGPAVEDAPADETAADAGPKTVEGDEDWSHDHLEFKGDKLAIRVPSPTNISGLITLMDGATAQEGSRYSRRFLKRHLSAPSFEHVFDRMSNPDETEYGIGATGELLGAILNIGMPAYQQAAKEAAEG